MNEEILKKTYEEVVSLKDLFLRRLMDDKVKTAAISHLKEQNDTLQQRIDEKNLSGFIKELLLVCDRIDCQKNADELTLSVRDELLDLLARREVYQMIKPTVFDPKWHNAVGTIPATEEFPEKSVVHVVRNGYLLRDQVFRPADVIVAVKPTISED